MDESSKTCKIDIQDVKIKYQIDELIKCLPKDKALGHAGK